MLGNASKLAKLARKLSSWKPAEGEIEQQDKEMKQTEEKLQEYKPCKPGRVIYCYRYEGQTRKRAYTCAHSRFDGSKSLFCAMLGPC